MLEGNGFSACAVEVERAKIDEAGSSAELADCLCRRHAVGENSQLRAVGISRKRNVIEADGVITRREGRRPHRRRAGRRTVSARGAIDPF